MKRVLKYTTMMVSALMVSAACNGSVKSSQQKEQASMESKGKILIVFFSHAGENYGVGNVKVGNTKLVGDQIQKLTGGDEFEIVAEKSYDMTYDALTKLAKKEAENNEKPAFKGEVNDMDQYETIFIGGPVWWGTYPQVMFTFFDKYDLNGRILTPQGWLVGGSVVIDGNKIKVVSNIDLHVVDAEIIDAKGCYVVPGGIDTHAHGGGGHDFMEGTESPFRFFFRLKSLYHFSVYSSHFFIILKY